MASSCMAARRSMLLAFLLLMQFALCAATTANASVRAEDRLGTQTNHPKLTGEHQIASDHELSHQNLIRRSSSVSELDSDIRSILLDLWSSTGGSNWINSTNWNTNATVCSWHGITCDGNQEITKLLLNSNNLVGTIPQSLSNLSSLQVFSFRINDISGPLPAWICRSLQLTAIDLTYTQIAGTMLDCWQAGAALSQLMLADLAITGSLPPSLGNLQYLSNLDLRGTQLTGPIPDSWQHLTSLTRFVLSACPLQSSLPHWIGNLPLLQELLLSNSQVIGNLPAELGKLSNLQVLDLSNNPGVIGVLPTELGNFTSLQTFLLSRTGLSGEIPTSFTRLTNLQVLAIDSSGFSGNPFPSLPISLSYLTIASSEFVATLDADFCKLTLLKVFVSSYSLGLSGPIPTCIQGMTHLSKIYMDHCYYNGPLPVELFSLTQIQLLDLRNNAFRGAIPIEFGQLTQLRQADLSNNWLNGSIPQTISRLTQLSFFGIGQNELDGDFDLNWLPPSLFTLDLAYNNMTFSSIATCASSARSVAGYTGPVLSLTELLLNGNRINFPFRDVMKCFAPMAPALITLLLQSTGLTGGLTLADIAVTVPAGPGTMQLVSGFQALVTITVSNNLLDSVTVVNTLSAIGTLLIIDASANQMVGSIADTASRAQRLLLHDNPYLRGIPTNNTAVPGWGPVYLLPAFVTIDNTNLNRNDTLSLLCPALVGSTGQEFQVDPSYLNWEHCHCLPGYRTTAPEGNWCEPCPAELLCSDAMYAPVHAVSNGYYPYPLPLSLYNNDSSLLLSNAVMIPCQFAQRCNPDTQAQYQCASGSDPNSLLCSRCLRGFFDAEGACNQCATWAQWLVPIILLIAAIGFLIIQIAILATEERTAELSKRSIVESSLSHQPVEARGFEQATESQSSNDHDISLLGSESQVTHTTSQSEPEVTVSRNEESSTSTLLIILTFWLQSQHTLSSVSNTGSDSHADRSHGFMHYVSSTASLTPLGLECVIDGWDWPSQWWLTVLSPVWLGLLSSLIFLVGRLRPFQIRLQQWLNLDAASTSPSWGRMNLRLLLSLWSLTYMGVAQMILSSWRCESVTAPDATDSFSFLTAAPFITCGSQQHRNMLIVGMIMFTLFTLALPSMMLWFSWKQRSIWNLSTVAPSSSFLINGREMEPKSSDARATVQTREREHALSESLLSPSMRVISADDKEEMRGSVVQTSSKMQFDLQAVMATTACTGLRSSCWQWQSIITGRKLLLAGIVALIPRGSSIAPILVIVMLLALLLSQTWVRPFQVQPHVLDYNLLESCLLLQISALFLAQVLSAAAGAQQQLLEAGASFRTQAGVVPTLLDPSALEVVRQLILGIGIALVSIAVMQAVWRLYQKRQKKRA